MLDHLREQASATPFPEEEVPIMGEAPAARRRSGPFLGMTAQQRLILALMLLAAVCTLGTMFLLIMGKIMPAFLF